MDSINIFLSAPPLTPDALAKSKAYLFLVQDGSQEHVVGTVIATRIEQAMRVVSDAKPDVSGEELVHVEGGVFCYPERLPTPMGVARLFVASSHRRMGIATALLDAAATTFIHACPLSPERGEVAFSQPTSMGKQVMDGWGKGNIRIYEE
jgi:N-acetyltransferase